MLNIVLKNWLNCEHIEIPQLYLVGGTVRDLFLNNTPKDIDIVCKNAKELAQGIAACKNATLIPMEKKPYEPCYRVVDREDRRNFLDIAEMRGNTINDDLHQRDFIIDAIAIEIHKDGSTGKTIDPLHGIDHIKNKTIKIVHERSIVSDPLRILRAFRLAATLNFSIEASTLKEIESRTALLKNVSAERIMAELVLILRTSQSAYYFKLMDRYGVLGIIFPEINMMKGCTQNGFHHKDVWEHSLLVMEHAENIINLPSDHFGEWSNKIADLLNRDNRLPFFKLSALLHDIGKPATKIVMPDTGQVTFCSHDKEGAKLIDGISERLNISNQDREFMVLLVAEHLQPLYLAPEEERSTIKMTWFRKMGDDSVPALILNISDVMSSLGPASDASYRKRQIDWAKKSVREYFVCIKAVIESPNLITGDDLIALNISPGPEMGNLLLQVRNAQDTGTISSREEAIELVKEYISEKR